LDASLLQRLYHIPSQVAENIVVAWTTSSISRRHLKNAFFAKVRNKNEFQIRLIIFYAFWIAKSDTTKEEIFNEYTRLFWEDPRLGCCFLLCHNSGVHCLRDHMRAELNSENLYFFLLTSDFESLPDDLRKQYSQRIMKMYFTANCDHAISISSGESRKTLTYLPRVCGTVPAHFFRKSQQEVLNVIQQGPFIRLCNNPESLQLVRRRIYQEIETSLKDSRIRIKLSKFVSSLGRKSSRKI